MFRCSGLLIRGLAMLALGLPLFIAQAGTAKADHRHRGGDRHDHWRHHGGWDHGWHGHHRHRRHHHRHRGSSISGLFIWDMTPPPPPPRYVVVEPPPPVIIQRPPMYLQAPPQAYCREYTTTAYVNGRPVESYGTACRQPDGSWRIVSMN
ncbi:hypothetical protein [Thalassobaculum sp.]|uniref:hypothetical protein n=1 Tax=Thalassobaculum sp. TaxID=2022740 RepID=UPI0032EACE92